MTQYTEKEIKKIATSIEEWQLEYLKLGFVRNYLLTKMPGINITTFNDLNLKYNKKLLDYNDNTEKTVEILTIINKLSDDRQLKQIKNGDELITIKYNSNGDPEIFKLNSDDKKDLLAKALGQMRLSESIPYIMKNKVNNQQVLISGLPDKATTKFSKGAYDFVLFRKNWKNEIGEAFVFINNNIEIYWTDKSGKTNYVKTIKSENLLSMKIKKTVQTENDLPQFTPKINNSDIRYSLIIRDIDFAEFKTPITVEKIELLQQFLKDHPQYLPKK